MLPETSAPRNYALKASVLTLIVLAFVSSVVAQNYMFNQVGLATGSKPAGAALADFNGDGRLDVAVANQGDNTVSVILTKPDGTFATRVTLTLTTVSGNCTHITTLTLIVQ
jgi:FG-GAP-like repeat